MKKQAMELVDKMRADPEVDFHNDWKIVTLFVGGNDLCGSCGVRLHLVAYCYD